VRPIRILIRPISDLRNKTPEIERICRKSGEPVFITKNGENYLVVLSAAAYERDQARLKLYELLAAAESDVRKGDRGGSPEDARRRASQGARVKRPVRVLRLAQLDLLEIQAYLRRR